MFLLPHILLFVDDTAAHQINIQLGTVVLGSLVALGKESAKYLIKKRLLTNIESLEKSLFLDCCSHSL